jgi:phosphatidylglycerol:prolipoprotein diacylglycerol transferase
MLPVLFALGPFKFYTFSLFLIIAFFASAYIFWRKGREEHYPEDELFDAFLKATFLGVIWSRVGFIVFYFNQFGLHPLSWINIFDFPGFVPLFGVLAAAWSLYRSAQKQKWDGYEILDFGSLSLTLTMAVLWLGNFFSGAEFGTPTQLPWGFQFPSVFDRRHPLQLYGFGLYMLLFFFMFWAESRYRTFSWYRAKKDSAQSGFLFCMFCIFTGLIGSFLWMFSPTQAFFYGVPIDIVLRVALVLYGLILLFQRSGRSFSFRRRR